MTEREADHWPSHDVPESVHWLKGLRCVAAVVAHGSTTRAAQALHLSQPATTRAVLDLEAKLGQRLFERGARGMRATPLGQQVATRAMRLRVQLELGAAEALARAGSAQAEAGRPGPRPARFAEVVAPASLKALVALSSSGSESRAALALRISQPAVHRALRLLADACGVPLFRRSAQGLQLTEAGHALLRRVKLAMAELRALGPDGVATQDHRPSGLVIGTLPLSVHQVLPQAVTRLRQQLPGVEVTVVDGTHDSLMPALQCADIDLIVGARRPQLPADLVWQALFHDEIAVVARRGHPCLQGSSSLAELQRWSWVLPLTGTSAREALVQAFAAAGLPPPRSQLQSSSPQFVRNIVAHSDQLAITSRSQAQAEVDAGLLTVVPVSLGLPHRAIGITLRSGAPSPLLRTLVQTLHEVAANGRS